MFERDPGPTPAEDAYVRRLAELGQATLAGKLLCLFTRRETRFELSPGETRRTELLVGPIP